MKRRMMNAMNVGTISMHTHMKYIYTFTSFFIALLLRVEGWVCEKLNICSNKPQTTNNASYSLS